MCTDSALVQLLVNRVANLRQPAPAAEQPLAAGPWLSLVAELHGLWRTKADVAADAAAAGGGAAAERDAEATNHARE